MYKILVGNLDRIGLLGKHFSVDDNINLKISEVVVLIEIRPI